MNTAFGRHMLACVTVTLMTAASTMAQTGTPIPKSGWTLKFVDSADATGGLYGAAGSFDGNAATFWHTRWNGGSDALPHEIQVDLGASYAVNGFRYLPRQDGTPNGRIARYEFYVSSDGTNWGTAAVSGTLSNLATEQQVNFPTRGGRYVRLRALSEVSGSSYTSMAELGVLAEAAASGTVPRGAWTVKFVDSQDATGGAYLAVKSFDGNPSTFWHTRWNGGSDPLPHEIQIDLGASYPVTGFRYLPRQDGTPNGGIARYEFFVSADGVTWGGAVASGTLANIASEQQVNATAKSGRYVRLRALSEVNGGQYTSMAEFNVLTSSGGGSNQPPTGSITAPAGAVAIAPGQSVTFAGAGSDPDGNLPLTYAWNFGAGGPGTSTLKSPGSITFPAAGVYTVSLTVRDGSGTADPSPPTRTITVQSASGASLIPTAGWRVWFVDSEETVVEDDAAANAFDGNPASFWQTRWAVAQPAAPPHELQIDLGAVYNLAGFRYLPRQDSQFARVGDYEFYVSSNGASWGSPVATGAFADSNSSAASSIMFPPVSGRYVRIRALSSANGDVNTAIAELGVYQRGAGTNQAPVVSISAPAQGLTIPAGSAVVLAGSASDPDGNTPLGYRWTVSPGSGIPDMTTASPGLVHFDRAGTFVAALTAVDALGASGRATRTITVVGGTAIPQSGWTLQSVDSQELSAGFYPGTAAFDGNPTTIWHTQYSTTQPPPPHTIAIDLGAGYTISGFRYQPRQDGNENGNISGFTFSVSGGTTFGAPIAAGSFANTDVTKEVLFAPTAGRFVQLRALSEVNGNTMTSAAEIQVLRPQCGVLPSARLVTPRSRELYTSSAIAVRAEPCLAPGQGVRLIVDGGTGAPGGTQADRYAAPYSATFSGLRAGEHVFEAVVIDGAGIPVSGAAARDIATPVAVGDAYVALGDGITLGGGDNDPSDDNPSDGRTTLGAGYPGVLADRLAARLGRPVTVANEGIAAATAQTVLAALPAVLAKHPAAQRFLLIIGHNDAQVDHAPSGIGLRPGNAGYAGSFKDRVQRIILAVNAAGRKLVLAKAPALLPVNGADDLLMQNYNRVIDELALDPANQIQATPADFHSYFANHLAEYADDVLLNGRGYQSMAGIWLSVLAP